MRDFNQNLSVTSPPFLPTRDNLFEIKNRTPLPPNQTQPTWNKNPTFCCPKVILESYPIMHWIPFWGGGSKFLFIMFSNHNNNNTNNKIYYKITSSNNSKIELFVKDKCLSLSWSSFSGMDVCVVLVIAIIIRSDKSQIILSSTLH